MLPNDVFEACFLLSIHYPKRASKEIDDTFNWKTTHYSWLKELLNPHSSIFYLYGGNFLSPLLTAIAFFQHINPCDIFRSLQIALIFSLDMIHPHRSWIMFKTYSNGTYGHFFSITLPLTLNEFWQFSICGKKNIFIYLKMRVWGWGWGWGWGGGVSDFSTLICWGPETHICVNAPSHHWYWFR